MRLLVLQYELDVNLLIYWWKHRRRLHGGSRENANNRGKITILLGYNYFYPRIRDAALERGYAIVCRLSVCPWRWGMFFTQVGILRK